MAANQTSYHVQPSLRDLPLITPGGVGGRMDVSMQMCPSPEEKQYQVQEMSQELSSLYEPESKLPWCKETNSTLNSPPPSFVNCQIISVFTFPWVNLGLIIMPLPVMRPIVRFTQVRHQMADCFAKHKCYKTANSVMLRECLQTLTHV